MAKQKSPARPAGRAPVRYRPGNRWNKDRREIFLASLGETANVTRSARKAEMSLAAAYRLKGRDAAFAHAWREALDVGYSELEMSLLSQSIHGSETIETFEMRKGKDGSFKWVKKKKGPAFAVGLRLFTMHREEVMAFRRERAEAEGPSAMDRARDYLDEIDARLRASEAQRALAEAGPADD